MIFDDPEILNQFLQSWRETGSQRCGYLYGKYIVDDHIPLGIQALVSAIYEPPQKYKFFKIFPFLILCY